MSKSFNLRRFVGALARQVGATNFSTRRPLTHWNLEDVLKYHSIEESQIPVDKRASIRDWKTKVLEKPMLMDALKVAMSRRENDVRKLKEQWYGERYLTLTPAQNEIATRNVEDTTITWLGYDDEYGAYSAQAGAYVPQESGTVVESAMNSFSFFHQKIQLGTRESLDKSIATLFNSLNAGLSEEEKVQFDMSDVQAIVKTPPSTYQPEGDAREDADIPETYVRSLAEDSEDGANFWNNPPVMGDNSKIGLNGAGYSKLMSSPKYNAGYVGVLQNVLRTPSAAAFTSINDLENAIQHGNILDTDGNIRDAFNKAVQKINARPGQVKSKLPEYEAENLSRKTGKLKRSGVEEINPIMNSHFKLQREIIAAMGEAGVDLDANEQINLDDGTKARILEILNNAEFQITRPSGRVSTVSRAKKPLPMEELEARISEISNDQVINDNQFEMVGAQGFRSVSDVGNYMNNKVANLKHGQYTLEEAVKFGAILFSGKESMKSDPITKAPALSGQSFSPMWQGVPSDKINANKSDLKNTRSSQLASTYAEEKARKEQAEAESAAASESADPVAVVDEAQEAAEAQQVVDEGVGEGTEELLGRVPQVKEPLGGGMEEIYDELDEEEGTLANRTVKNLIKIARELDRDNKYFAAEEVHRVIRSYKGRAK